MSNEEIIGKWKAQEGEAPAPTEKDAPANPAGDSELNEDEAEKVAGGSTEYFLTLGCCPPVPSME